MICKEHRRPNRFFLFSCTTAATTKPSTSSSTIVTQQQQIAKSFLQQQRLGLEFNAINEFILPFLPFRSFNNKKNNDKKNLIQIYDCCCCLENCECGFLKNNNCIKNQKSLIETKENFRNCKI